MAGVKKASDCQQSLIQEIHQVVLEYSRDKKWREEYMKLEYEMMIREARGEAKGDAVIIRLS